MKEDTVKPIPDWRPIRHVVLDWNGTLIDDCDLAVACVNVVCKLHGMPPIDRYKYRSNFQFPISRFYQELGFDFNKVSFNEIVEQYHLRFNPIVEQCELQPYAIEFLDSVQQSGRAMSVLSASQTSTLIKTLNKKGVSNYFDHVLGLDDARAESKLEKAHALQAALNVAPNKVLYIGDTTHDADVADILGWNSIIVSCGHQGDARLSCCRAYQCNDFSQLIVALNAAEFEEQ